MLNVYVWAGTTPSLSKFLSPTDVAVAAKTLGAEGPYCRSGRGEAGQPLGTGVFFFAENRVAASQLEIRVFLAGNRNAALRRGWANFLGGKLLCSPRLSH